MHRRIAHANRRPNWPLLRAGPARPVLSAALFALLRGKTLAVSLSAVVAGLGTFLRSRRPSSNWRRGKRQADPERCARPDAAASQPGRLAVYVAWTFICSIIPCESATAFSLSRCLYCPAQLSAVSTPAATPTSGRRPQLASSRGQGQAATGSPPARKTPLSGRCRLTSSAREYRCRPVPSTPRTPCRWRRIRWLWGYSR